MRGVARSGVTTPPAIHDVSLAIAEMRLFKDAHEIQLLRCAGEISAEGAMYAPCACQPGLYEYQVEADIPYAFVRHGARAAPPTKSIVAGGANARVLHHVGNRDVLRDGDLLLIDAGCEYQGYAGDITRTFR